MADVLIVEDEHDIRAAYSYELGRAGFAVREAVDGEEALVQLEAKSPDVMVLDMLMPGLSGLDFLRRAQISQRYPNVRVIAFSNIDTQRVIDEANALGVTEYLIKVETSPHQLVEAVQRLLPK